VNIYVEIGLALMIVWLLIPGVKTLLTRSNYWRDLVCANKIFHPNSISRGRIWDSYILFFPTCWLLFDNSFENHPMIFSVILLVYVAIFASDGTDGIVARACGLASDEGAILDAEADKWADLPLFIAFFYAGMLPYNWLGIFIVLMIVADIIGQNVRNNNGNPAAKMIGKTKTVFKISTIIYIAYAIRYDDFEILSIHVFNEYIVAFMVCVSSILAIASMESKLPIEEWWSKLEQRLN